MKSDHALNTYTHMIWQHVHVSIIMQKPFQQLLMASRSVTEEKKHNTSSHPLTNTHTHTSDVVHDVI